MPEQQPYRDDDPTRQIRRPAPLRNPLTGRPTPVAPRPGAPTRTRPEAPRARPAATGAPVDATRRMPRPPAARPGGYPAAAPAGDQAPGSASTGARPPGGRPPGGNRPVQPARPSGRPGARRRRPGVWVVVLLLAAVLVAYPLSLGLVAWTNVQQVEALAGGVDTPGTTFLLVGSDSRAGLTDEQAGELATGTESDAAGTRTDTILLLHVPSGTGPSVLVSLPRDSYVEVPGDGMNKINAAYAVGGPQLLAATVEGATGIGVDSYVETGFGGFANIVDALDGVDVCLPGPLQDPMAGIDLPEGCQTLQGPDALGFVRSRMTDARGDLARVERQRQLLSGIVDETTSPSLLLNPPRAYATAAAGGSALTVDEGTSPLDLGRFLLGMRSVSGEDGINLTVPVSDPDLRTDVGSAVAWDEDRAEELFAALRADDTVAVRELVAAETDSTG